MNYSMIMLSDFDRCAKNDCMYLPVLMWLGMNLVVTCLAAVLVTFLQVFRHIRVTILWFLSIGYQEILLKDEVH